MVSLMTPPPSSSPSQPGYIQPTAAKRSNTQLESECPASDAPLPKHRRRGSFDVDGLGVVNLLNHDNDEKDDENGQTHPVRIPKVPPFRPGSSSTSGPRPQLRGMRSAKALSTAAVNRPITPDQPTPPAQWPQQHWQRPAPLTSAPSYSQHAWAQPPPMRQPGPERHHSGDGMSIPPQSYLPGWNYALPHNGSYTVQAPDIPSFPQPTGHQHPMLVPSHQQPWPHQQWHGYDMPSLANTYVGYSPLASQMPHPGTASYPIDLDGPVQNLFTPPIYTPSALPASQLSAYGPAGSPISLNGIKQDNIYRNLVPRPPSVSQPAVVPPPILATQPTQVVEKQPARQRAKNPVPDVPMNEPELCPEQEDLVKLIESGKNVFYTGSAGCGKSTVLKAFVKRLKDQKKHVHIVAPTGRAALNVGGTTTWTFAGWTPDSHKLPIGEIKVAAHGKRVYNRLIKTDVLVVDEISMVENLHFERLNILMKAARHNPNLRKQPAFGGCQIVVTGDFCQLPPVKPFQHCIECGREMTQRSGEGGKLVHVCRQHGENADEDKWAFRSKAWQECDFEHVHLKKIHRQNDQAFISMLQKCRLGDKLTDSEIRLLMDHKSLTSQATKLFSTRKEAGDVNRQKFKTLAGVNHPFWCHDTFFWNEKHPNLKWKNRQGDWEIEPGTALPPTTKAPLHALEDHRWGKCVQLKQGMLVVLLTNLDLEAGLCNGSQGLIKGFEVYDPKNLPMREKYNGRGKKTVEAEPGQRVIRGDHAEVQEAEINKFITSESAPIKKWPIVRFHNGVVRTVYAECSISQLGDEKPYCLLARTQIPLAPAWAMTIHKSQSLTLDRVIVNLSRAFEEGQVYVALSRATGLLGLKIEGDEEFLRSKLMVNPEVTAFLKEKFGDIYGVNDPEGMGTPASGTPSAASSCSPALPFPTSSPFSG